MTNPKQKKNMTWLLFALMTVCFWGLYGVFLHTGQMNMNDALRLLDALKESEKELQDLRRPQVPKESSNVEKDW